MVSALTSSWNRFAQRQRRSGLLLPDISGACPSLQQDWPLGTFVIRPFTRLASGHFTYVGLEPKVWDPSVYPLHCKDFIASKWSQTDSFYATYQFPGALPGGISGSFLDHVPVVYDYRCRKLIAFMLSISWVVSWRQRQWQGQRQRQRLQRQTSVGMCGRGRARVRSVFPWYVTT